MGLPLRRIIKIPLNNTAIPNISELTNIFNSENADLENVSRSESQSFKFTFDGEGSASINLDNKAALNRQRAQDFKIEDDKKHDTFLTKAGLDVNSQSYADEAKTDETLNVAKNQTSNADDAQTFDVKSSDMAAILLKIFTPNLTCSI